MKQKFGWAWAVRVVLAVLLVMRYFAGPLRREVDGSSSVAMALASMLCGAVMTVSGVLDVVDLIGAWSDVSDMLMQQVLWAMSTGKMAVTTIKMPRAISLTVAMAHF